MGKRKRKRLHFLASVRMGQRVTSSRLAATMVSPSCEKVTDDGPAGSGSDLCPLSVNNSYADVVSHSLTAPSAIVPTSRLPSGEKAKDDIAAWWLVRNSSAFFFPVARSHNRITQS